MLPHQYGTDAPVMYGQSADAQIPYIHTYTPTFYYTVSLSARHRP